MGDMIVPRNPYASLNASKVSDISIEAARKIYLKTKTHEQKYAENLKTINELETRVSTLRNLLDTESVVLETRTLKLSNYESETKALEAQRDAIKEEKLQLETNRNKLKSWKLSLKDQHILDIAQKKFQLYKTFTGIRWNFPALKDHIKGYVTNKQDYIKGFCFNNNEDKWKTTNLLWKEIQLSAESKGTKEDCEEITESITQDSS
ncbi:uncharacterized protein LOC105702662 [Orussus abietinus]|uniref:uncharacterized protein LOC105702662 n=1 Tax=Orussus abietinus TaxID=222816 RepID=UPI0006256DC6|nr:uncharacterized protein LOC105702662 [Orussus abietinus]